MKRLSRFAGNHPILEELGVSAIEVGIPFQIRWQMAPVIEEAGYEV